MSCIVGNSTSICNLPEIKSSCEAKVEPEVVPKITEANKIAVEIAEKIEPKLTEHEESFFIAGFVEAVKYISNFSA